MEKEDQVVTVNIRVRKSLKDGFEKVIQAQDQSITQAVKGLFEVTVKNNTLPFTPVKDFFTPKEYFQTGVEKAEELALILQSLTSGEEPDVPPLKVALKAMEKTVHYIKAHLDEINKFEQGLIRSENMTFTVANLTWANLLREIGQAEYNLKAFDEFSARRAELVANVYEISRLCIVLRGYLSGKQSATVSWSDLMADRPLAAMALFPDAPGVSASLQYEYGSSGCSVLMENRQPEDVLESVLEFIGPDTAFRLYVFGPDAEGRSHLTQKFAKANAFTQPVSVFNDAGPEDAAAAWRLYTGGRGAVLNVNAPDFDSMMNKLYGINRQRIEKPNESRMSSSGNAEEWAEAVSRAMRLPAERVIVGKIGK